MKTAAYAMLALCLGFTGPALAQNSAQGPATSVQANDKKPDLTFDEARAAAERGEASAQNSLAKMYAKGRDVAQDDAKAVVWYRKAAEQGLAEAQYNLGVMYVSGRGIARDDVQAVSWFRKAAEQGDVDAQTNLGTMYLMGRGVARDLAEATAWYRKAADQGDIGAQEALRGLESGSGLPKSPQ